jgi:hypothetical protein
VELLVRAFNTGVSALLKNPRTGPWIGKGITVVSYAGRRSGRTFSTPVFYQRDGDQVTIRVDLPDVKNWWRNFTGDGDPVTLRLDGGDRSGHAVARRTGAVWAIVTVRLDPPVARRPWALTSSDSTCHRAPQPDLLLPRHGRVRADRGDDGPRATRGDGRRLVVTKTRREPLLPPVWGR